MLNIKLVSGLVSAAVLSAALASSAYSQNLNNEQITSI